MKKTMKRAVSLLLCLLISGMLLSVPVSAAEANGALDGRAVYTFSSLAARLQNALAELLQRLNASLPQRGTENVTENVQMPAENSTASEEKRPASGAADAVSTYESRVIELVNAERAKFGQAPLKYNKALADGAREKSADMQKRGYFSHTSPTYGSPFDQMRARGIVYRSAGENIAMGYATPEAVVRAWMNSEGHRANILSSRYTEIGVGYVQTGNYCTQWFTG